MVLLFHVVQIILMVATGVHAVEDRLGPGNGAAKKMAVLNPVLDSANALGKILGVSSTSSGVYDAVSHLIDAAVALYNALGVFSHLGNLGPK